MFLYRALLLLTLGIALAFRRLGARITGRPLPRDLAERWLLDSPAPAAAPRIWLHAASNGELASTRGLIAALLARDPALRLLVTCNTPTGRALAESWGEARIEVRLAPIDLRGPVRRALDLWRPSALVIVENELWPERLLACARRGIPVLVIGARMSEKSHRLWARLPRLARRILGAVSYLAAQDAASEARFRDLGLNGDRIGPPVNLKASAAAATTRTEAPPGRTATLLAASTHEGEDEIVLDAFMAARARLPKLRLIIAPRHPRRSAAIAAEIRARGLAFAARSAGEERRDDQPVYLADTLGEMDRWYAAAGMTFVGGSLVDRGGHTPFEPAAYRSALITGPHVANAAPAYAALDAAGAVSIVADAAGLADAITALADAARQTHMAKRASEALGSLAEAGGTEAFIAALGRLGDRPALAAGRVTKGKEKPDRPMLEV